MYFNNITELDNAMRNGELSVTEYVEERNRLLSDLPEWFPEEPCSDDVFNDYFTQLLEEADRKIKAAN